MSPPGAFTVVVVGAWASPIDAVITVNNSTLHRSLMRTSFFAGSHEGAACKARSPPIRYGFFMKTILRRLRECTRRVPSWFENAGIIRLNSALRCRKITVCSVGAGGVSAHPFYGGPPMTVGARRVFACATAVTVACLATVAGVRAQGGPGGAAAAGAGERVPMVEETFKTVQLLRGIPVDTFFEVMGTFASSMGNDCTFCHASNAALDKSAFATQTPRIQRARQMITMMNTINNVNQVFEKYIQALGGADKLPKLTSYAAKGTYSGFDTDFSTVPIELYAKAPNQETTVVHLTIGTSTRVFNGTNAWVAGPEQPMPLLTLTGGNIDR